MSNSNNSIAHLVLEDGTHYRGIAIGKKKHKFTGEIVFNTGMTGYQEILTDPSYAQQIVILTYTQIGNYGINKSDNQSRQAFANGLVIKELSPVSSSWRQEEDLETFLLKQELGGIASIDTRALTCKIRSQGSMRSIIYTSDLTAEELNALKAEVKAMPTMQGLKLLSQVSTKKTYTVSPDTHNPKGQIALLDFGLKRNIIDSLLKRGYQVRVWPYDSLASDILSSNPAGIMLSNGPGDPGACEVEVALIRELIKNSQVPIFGICLGHQLLAQAMGAKTFKMKFGHRGSNHPVIDLATHKVMITSQNHGFAVAQAESKSFRVTHRSLNDHTVEGLRYLESNIPIYSVQFHPEACPGPSDASYLFDQFVEDIESCRV